MTEALARVAASAAFRPALPLDQLATVHVPFQELGFDSQPERSLAEGVRQEAGLTLLVGEPGNGKSSVLAHVADHLADTAASDGRLYLPLFVPIAARGGDAADLQRFGSIAIAQLLGTFDELSEDQEQAFVKATAEQITRQGPSRTLNAKFVAKVFGAGLEGGAESQAEVVTVTTSGQYLDQHGGLATLAHTLRARGRELVVIVEDTDGWTLQDGESGKALARDFFGAVLAPLATADVSVVAAVQTHWTREVPEFEPLNERALKRVVLPRFDARTAETTVRRVISQRLEWKLNGLWNAADVVTDSAVETLAERLCDTSSVRTVLTLLRDALDRLEGEYPARLDTQHLVETV